MDSHIDEFDNISLRFLSGDNASTIWIDDLISGSPYLTDPTGSTGTSLVQRYLQYQILFSTTDSNVSPSSGAWGVSINTATDIITFTPQDDIASNTYGFFASSTATIFTSNSGPIQDGRLQLEVGISPSSTNATRTYSDTLTFVVTGTF